MKRIAVIAACLMHFALPAFAQTATEEVHTASLDGPGTGSQYRQNLMAAEDGLRKIEDDKTLLAAIRKGDLVPIPRSRCLRVDSRLESKWQYVTPAAAAFLADFGEAFCAEFERPLYVNSAVRTVKRQKALAKENANAAPVAGPKASTHLYGSTFDIAKLRMSEEVRNAVAGLLLFLEQLGVIEVTEEHRQAVFHVMVSAEYLKKTSVAATETSQQFK